MVTVGSDKYRCEVIQDWAKLPEGSEVSAVAVAVDSQDRVFCCTSSTEHPVITFGREGKYLSSWGEGLFDWPHAISVDKEDNLWVVDRDRGQVFKFTPQGELLLTIGTKGHRSDTGVDPEDSSSKAYQKVTQPGEPFNRPTGVAVAPSGEIFVSDGYANCRIHKFSPKGEHLLSWGEPGDGDGQFNLPHGIFIDRQGRVVVADRENDRIQVFTQEGELIGICPTRLNGPAAIYMDDEDVAYVAEHNRGLICILTLRGERKTQWGSLNNYRCHGISVDSHGDIYVVQPLQWRGDHKVVKFVRTG